MIDQKMREAIYCLHQEGMGARAIARQLHLSRNTVNKIILQKGVMPELIRKDKIRIDQKLLARLYAECQGYKQRVHEKLIEEEGITVSYSTLTRMLREYGLQKKSKKNDRCGKAEDEPGYEMQHDTSKHVVKLGEKKYQLECSLLYFRYSKVRYMKYYRSFDRFKMKCFFHEALTHFGYAAKRCIIDNTNLARLRGTGREAIIVPEMEKFSARYGFKYICHEKNHSNRKAGNEKGFATVESNFLPGRSFTSMEDLNQQALTWATVLFANRPQSKSGLIPVQAFEQEKPFLERILSHIPAPYKTSTRDINQYGNIPYDGNEYWVPGTNRFSVMVLEYGDKIEIYHNRKVLISYVLPPHGVKNQIFRPEGFSEMVRQPVSHYRPAVTEEKNLRLLSDPVNHYVDFINKQKGIKLHHFIRRLYSLSKRVALPAFSEALSRALKYGITDISTIERICILQLRSEHCQLPLFEIDEGFEQRENFIEGQYSDEVDLSHYDRLLDGEDG